MPELNEVERAREWLRKTYDLETHTGRAYTISTEHGRLDVEKVLAAYAVTIRKETAQTRFDEFDDSEHPCNRWWEEHGQYMMSGGGRREFIWACRGWIAREQLAAGVDVTGDPLNVAAAIEGRE